MTQEAIQISETPPLPGLKLVQDVNKALQTIATDFAGPTDPAGLPGCGPYCTWADTGNMLLKRRNAANTAWEIEGALFSGIEGIASTAEAQALTNDSKALTPKKLADAFGGANQGLTSNGYQKLPGGLIIQWGRATVGASSGTITFPITFPNAKLAVVLTDISEAPTGVASIAIDTDTTLSSFTFHSAQGTTPVQVGVFNWFAIGR